MRSEALGFVVFANGQLRSGGDEDRTCNVNDEVMMERDEEDNGRNEGT